MRTSRRVVFSRVPSLLLLVGLEVAARLRHAGLPGALEQLGANAELQCSRSSLTRGWEPVPGSCGHNALGMLSPDLLPSADLRLLVLGDSIAAQQRWVEVTQASLRVGGQVVDVQNAGVSGYDPCQELRALVELDSAFRPDVVLLQLCPNDLAGSPVLVPLPDGRVRYHTPRGVLELPSWLLRSRAATWAVVRWGAVRGASEALARQDLVRCIGAVAQRARDAGALPLGVLFPVLSATTTEGRDAPLVALEEQLRLVLDQGDMAWLDLRPALEAGGDLSRYRSNPADTLHPGKAGQEAAGAAVGAFVVAALAGAPAPSGSTQGGPLPQRR